MLVVSICLIVIFYLLKEQLIYEDVIWIPAHISYHPDPSIIDMIRMIDFKASLIVHDTDLDNPMMSSQQVLNLEQLPNGYYLSKNFIGSLVAVCLMAISLHLGFTLPVQHTLK